MPSRMLFGSSETRTLSSATSAADTVAGGNAREALGPQRELALAFRVVLEGNVLRGAEYFIDGLAEPALGAIPDDRAAADQHENRRQNRHRQQRAHQFCAKPREGCGLPLFDPQFEETACEHEP